MLGMCDSTVSEYWIARATRGNTTITLAGAGLSPNQDSALKT
jgi:hypothetical protein